VLAHLWTGAPAPLEYIELILCRDVYHCTPSELEKQYADVVNAHLVCLAAEAKVAKMRTRKR